MTDNQTFTARIPEMAPLGVEVTPGMVREAWDVFVKPGQDRGEPQSGEMRILMAILRSVYAGLGGDSNLRPADEPPVHAIDVRFVFDSVDDYGSEEKYLELDRIERLATYNVTEDDTIGMAESFAQSDKLQILASRIGNVLNGETITP
jgi:hypothetical protein